MRLGIFIVIVLLAKMTSLAKIYFKMNESNPFLELKPCVSRF